MTTETLPIGLLPLIPRDLGSTPSTVGLLVTAYGLVVVIASIPLTRMTQRINRRRLLSTLSRSALLPRHLGRFVAVRDYRWSDRRTAFERTQLHQTGLM